MVKFVYKKENVFCKRFCSSFRGQTTVLEIFISFRYRISSIWKHCRRRSVYIWSLTFPSRTFINLTKKNMVHFSISQQFSPFNTIESNLVVWGDFSNFFSWISSRNLTNYKIALGPKRVWFTKHKSTISWEGLLKKRLLIRIRLLIRSRLIVPDLIFIIQKKKHIINSIQ